ncbi:conserved hypothetical protein [Pediculus humanus corporis]|uniref:Sugar transporter SWEET n=1 Tax=Pediculus humanus subsp. corporis TaxID=121224 RepID=E0VT83_PEDHC|nr:uncharacterized protein Phum_PHUM428040 [Pediculus humanus corporis]EEB16589.1 conserved hypothetical protein [Pediculus humanus corporis]
MKNTDVLYWRDILGTSASIWTILQMLSPVPTCYYFIRKKTVGDMIVTPYAVALTSCTLWLIYGIIINDYTIVKVNTIGATLQFSYTFCYYIHCTKKNDVRKQLGIGFLTIVTAFFYSMNEKNMSRLVTVFGLLCSIVTVLFFVSPLANMRYVIRVWNSESLPRLLIATTFIVSLQWFLYGYITNDGYIMITNFLGTLLSSLQLAMMFIIPRDSSVKYVSTV